jgi:hypothetical protein
VSGASKTRAKQARFSAQRRAVNVSVPDDKSLGKSSLVLGAKNALGQYVRYYVAIKSITQRLDQVWLNFFCIVSIH